MEPFDEHDDCNLPYQHRDEIMYCDLILVLYTMPVIIIIAGQCLL